MKTSKQIILGILNRQTSPRFAGWLISNNKRRYGNYTVEDFAAEIMQPLVKKGLVALIVIKGRTLYEITQEGRASLIEQEEVPLQVTPGRLVSGMGGLYVSPKHDIASQRGCHPGIASFGLSC